MQFTKRQTRTNAVRNLGMKANRAIVMKIHSDFKYCLVRFINQLLRVLVQSYYSHIEHTNNDGHLRPPWSQNGIVPSR